MKPGAVQALGLHENNWRIAFEILGLNPKWRKRFAIGHPLGASWHADYAGQHLRSI